VNGSSGSCVLLRRYPFLDRFDLGLDGISKTRENVCKLLGLVDTVLALSCRREVKVKIDLVVTICDPKGYLSAIAILLATRGIRSGILDLRDDVSSQIGRQI